MPFDGRETSSDPSPTAAKKSRSALKKAPVPAYRTVAEAATALWGLRDDSYRKGRPSTVPELPSPEEVVALAKHAADYPKAIPADQRRASTLAALTLVTRIREQLDTIELGLVTSGLTKGADKTITLADYAAAVGLNSEQSAEMRRLRLISQATNEAGRRDEKIGRRTRTADARTAAWLAQNAVAVRTAAKAVVANAAGFDDSLSEDIEEIADLLRSEPAVGPTTQKLVTRLRVLAGEASWMSTSSQGADRALEAALAVRKNYHDVFGDPAPRKAAQKSSVPKPPSG